MNKGDGEDFHLMRGGRGSNVPILSKK